MSVLLQLAQGISKSDILVAKDQQAYARMDKSTNVAECWPLAVVKVSCATDLIFVVKICLENKTPMVVRGAGTGKSGGAVPSKNSVVIDVTRLNRILLIDKENLLAEVEPGVLLADLQDEVRALGLDYPPDPASRLKCTLGGNVAENAAGPSTIKYGTTRDYLLGGQVIIGTGEVIDFGKRSRKGVAGYDIASLLCGSEGTLGVFTRLTLRLMPLAKHVACAMIYFADEKKALCAVNYIFNQGYLPKTLEYIDEICLAALTNFVPFLAPSTARAALIIECDTNFTHGADISLHELCASLKNFDVVRVDDSDEDLWHRRSLLSEACTHYLGHKLSEDIAVPLGKISHFGEKIKALAQKPHILIGIFGHAGDGNLHVQIMFKDVVYRERAQALRHEILMLVLALGGTIAAEHGVGLQKKAYLALEQSSALIALQKRIKKAFDPYDLLNPGKIFD